MTTQIHHLELSLDGDDDSVGYSCDMKCSCWLFTYGLLAPRPPYSAPLWCKLDTLDPIMCLHPGAWGHVTAWSSSGLWEAGGGRFPSWFQQLLPEPLGPAAPFSSFRGLYSSCAAAPQKPKHQPISQETHLVTLWAARCGITPLHCPSLIARGGTCFLHFWMPQPPSTCVTHFLY